MFVARPTATIQLWICAVVTAIIACLSIPGCQKKDDTASTSTSASDAPDSATDYVPPKQPEGVIQIENFDTLPKLDNGGRLLAAIHCEPEGFESRQGIAVLFTLRIPRAPDSALWIITRDPQANAWRATGEVAIVSPSGNEAVGPLYHFGDCGLTEIPVNIRERPRYATEWVWLFSTYDRRLDDLARAVTEKYRGALGLPAQSYAPAIEWLASEPTLEVARPTEEINGTPIENPPMAMHNLACLATARAEFASRMKVIDTAYRQAFENWTAVAGGSGAEAAAAVWQAVVDLRLLREEKFGDRTAKTRQFIFRQQLSNSVGPRVAEVLGAWAVKQLNDRFIASVTDYIDRGQDDYARQEIPGKTADKIKDWFVGTFANVLAGDDSDVNLDRLIEMLTRWGDALIDEAGYPNRAGQTASGDSDFRNLKASPDDGYLTGFAVKWDYDNVLNKRFGSHEATAKIPGNKDHTAKCTLTLADMRVLAGHGKIDAYVDAEGIPRTRQVSSLWILEYPNLHRQLEASEKEIRQRGNDGEKAWFDQVAGQNKAQAAAALRVLMYDLRALMQNDKIPVDERERSIVKLTVALMKSSPKPARPFLKPFAVVVHYYIQEYADYLWPSHLSQLIDMLDNRSLRSALALLPAPGIVAVYPNRDKDLDKVMLLDKQIPASCLPGGK